MMRNKAFSFINIAGLSVGIACCLMLSLYIQDEMSYDQHHKHKENIYRVTSRLSQNGEQKDVMATTSAPIVWGIKDEVPEFETVTRLVNPPGVALNLVRYEDKKFYEPNGYMADSTLFNIFTYTFIEGNPERALTDPNSIVLTENLATKIFNKEPALNKIISVDQGGAAADYKVTGVIKEQKNSHIQANFFISITSNSGWGNFLRSSSVLNEWAGQNFMLSYVKLKENHKLDDVIATMNKIFMKHGAEDLKAMGYSKTLGLEPITDIHLYSTAGGKSPAITYIYIIAIIAAFILLIACINFMNLSTAKATKRAGEVGLRKTLGAYRSSLISQFLGEALIIVTMAILVSLVIVQFALPAFNNFTGKTLTLESLNIIKVGVTLIAITCITGLVAGSYPAFYLSSFQPAHVLKGKSTIHSGNSVLRRLLVVFQFVIAITLVCAMITVGKQLRYIQQKNLGFDSNHRIILPLRTNAAQSHIESLGNELKKHAEVKGFTATNYIPGATILTDFHIYTQGGSMDNAIHFRRNPVEANYLDVLGLKIIAGRNFHENRTTDVEKNVIINREAARQLGFTPEKIIGEPLYFNWQGEKIEFNVVGVMEDYHQESLKEAIYPVLFFIPTEPVYDFMIVDVQSQKMKETLAYIENTWKAVNNDTPFEFSFLDDTIMKQYEQDRKTSDLITTFTIIAMIISCLGLYGLSTYMAERRVKEIGIRKVMGASVQQIVTMMSGEFVKLVILAFAIAIPLSWYCLNKWLEGFEYRTTADIAVFMLAGAAALLIAMVTVSFESVRAASGNPVKALRNE